MTDEDAGQTGSELYDDDEKILAEFKKCCETEAQYPGQYSERLKRAAEAVFEMLNRHNRAVTAKKK